MDSAPPTFAPPTAPASLSPLARYTAATSPDGWLTADGWPRLADDLDGDADRLDDDAQAEFTSPTGTIRGAYAIADRAQGRRDRAADCRARAAKLTVAAVSSVMSSRTDDRVRDSDGRYATGSLGAKCKCGHLWDAHTSAAPHTCAADGCDDCACPGFKADKSRAVSP